MAKKKTSKDDRAQPHVDGVRPESLPPMIRQLTGLWLNEQEVKDICQQFQESCVPNRQVLWTGMYRQQAQKWADQHNYQTLTTALGQLISPSDSSLHQKSKDTAGSPRYLHGASVIFAWYISQGDVVTVLSQPPPQRFNPSGRTYYQTVEEPIIKGQLGNRAVTKIIVVHPTVKGKACEFMYEIWPHDEVSLWTKRYKIPIITIRWRVTKKEKDLKHMQLLKARTELNVASKDKQLSKSSSPQKPPKKKKKKNTVSAGVGSQDIVKHPTTAKGTIKSQSQAVLPPAMATTKAIREGGKKKKKKPKKKDESHKPTVQVSTVKTQKKKVSTNEPGQKLRSRRFLGKRS
ncbi:unnamed protein product [Fusarium venenatum]|uniref:Uncharacterized protein n=1 Tax=Fusarium venenatum TaxID=56646 RepID=A0A2L2TB77_9HYPO